MATDWNHLKYTISPIFCQISKDPTYFAGINNAKFRKPVTPGDQLRMEIKIIRMRKTSLKVHGTAYIGQEIAAEADLLLVMETL